MAAFFREYGVISVLMIVAFSGYFLIGDRRGDIMDHTMEMLGTRLVELAAGDEEKAQVARQFADFSSRVERQEVAPEVVESVAANVLNLRARGAVITPEEAELMLFQEPDGWLPSPADSTRSKPAHAYAVASNSNGQVSQMDLQDLGKRMTVMFELADVFESAADTMMPHLQFSRDEGGIHVVIDPSMSAILETEGMKNLAKEMGEKDWVRWQENLAEKQERSARLLENQARRLARLDSVHASRDVSTATARLEAIQRIQKLALMGATTDLDTLILRHEMESLMQGFEMEFNTTFDSDGKTVQGVMVLSRPDSSGR